MYSDLAVAGRTISFNVTLNAGSGCDTPQLYLGFPGAATNPAVPVKVLRGFLKVCGAQQTVTFQVSDADVSRWDSASSSWVIVRGTYAVSIGSSATDIRLTGTMTV